MVKRQDVQLIDQSIFFADFPTDFSAAPYSNDLARILNVSAVSESIENLIQTIQGERLYQPNIGSGIEFRPFELSSFAETQLINKDIDLAIRQFEPRATLQEVIVNYVDGTNYFEVSVYFYVINIPELQVLNTIIKRDR